jgi:hypothetical protein
MDRTTMERPGGLLAAAILYFVLAFLVAGLGAMQLLLGLGGFAIVNLVVGALYAFIGYWILDRQHRGYTWGLWSAILSIGLTLFQAFGSTTLTVLLLPLYIVAAVLLWNNRRAFQA